MEGCREGRHCHSLEQHRAPWGCPPWLTTLSSPQKARWVLLVLILAVVGFGALMTQLFLWEYGDLHLFGPNQRPAPCYDPCE